MDTTAALPTRSQQTCAARLQRVIDYIHDHLDEPLDLIKLADIAHMSPWHWHRVYFGVYGETVAATVKRLRLHRAAGMLAHGDTPIAEVALKSGYPNSQSFNRIFHAAYGMPPARYRKEGSHTRFTLSARGESPMTFEVTIRELPPAQAITLEHRGSYMEIGRAFEQLFGVLASRNLLGGRFRMVALYDDDPDSVPEAELHSRAGIIPAAPLPAEMPLKAAGIAGGSYAVLEYRGPYADMKGAYDWLFGTWLPASGREAANAPVMEEYLNNPRDTAPQDLLTLICLPLA